MKLSDQLSALLSGVPARTELDERLKSVVQNDLPCVLDETNVELVMLLHSGVIKRCSGSLADSRGRLKTHAVMRDLEV